jgi:hypothetical protein
MELRTRKDWNKNKKDQGQGQGQGQGTRPFSCGQQLYGLTPQDTLGIKSRLKEHFSSDLPYCKKLCMISSV